MCLVCIVTRASSISACAFVYFTVQYSMEWDFPVAQLVKNPPAMQETPVRFLGREDPLEKRQATYSSIHGFLLWLRWQRICLQCGRPGIKVWDGKIPWRTAWQPTPLFLPREFPWREEPGGATVHRVAKSQTRLSG